MNQTAITGQYNPQQLSSYQDDTFDKLLELHHSDWILNGDMLKQFVKYVIIDKATTKHKLVKVT